MTEVVHRVSGALHRHITQCGRRKGPKMVVVGPWSQVTCKKCLTYKPKAAEAVVATKFPDEKARILANLRIADRKVHEARQLNELGIPWTRVDEILVVAEKAISAARTDVLFLGDGDGK